MPRSLGAFLVLTLMSAVTPSCSDSATAPSDYAPFAQTEVRVGAGAPALVNSTVTVHYTGWLYDGSKQDLKGLQFESSAGQEPFSFILGVGQVIAGWDQGVVGMRVGGLRRLVIPPSLAYGGTRNGPLPANATLVFEIELLDVE